MGETPVLWPLSYFLEALEIKKPFQDRGRLQAAEKFFEIKAIPGDSLRQFLPGTDAADRGEKRFLAF